MNVRKRCEILTHAIRDKVFSSKNLMLDYTNVKKKKGKK